MKRWRHIGRDPLSDLAQAIARSANGRKGHTYALIRADGRLRCEQASKVPAIAEPDDRVRLGPYRKGVRPEWIEDDLKHEVRRA